MEKSKGMFISQDRSWTATGDMLLLQLMDEEYSINGICRFLNRSRESVESRIRYLSVNREHLLHIRHSLRKDSIDDVAWAGNHGVHTGRLKIR
jgi:hypothetical protein